MKNHILVSLCSFSFLCMVFHAFGQLPSPANMSSTIKSASKIEKQYPSGNLQPHPSSKVEESLALPPVKPPKIISQQAEYLHPGALVFLNGRWEGNDHLFNLSHNIGVMISITKPENEAIPISIAQIKKGVEEIFNIANIHPQILTFEGEPPVPVFEIKIFIYPIEGGYAIYCEGRLFESVILERFKMDNHMAFQAITWQKQTLIVSPKSQIAEQIQKNVQEVASTFTQRFQNYERIKNHFSPEL